ncbi:MAG: glycoside hydrolase family 55 protein [Acidobacteriales bacterium]|nr:glycoside hydrolase family 55 protein [Terriglobales bacterium]
MTKPYSIHVALLVLALGIGAANAACSQTYDVVGDGVHDDTAGLQALFDARTSEVRFPVPLVCLVVSKTLKIHSGQTLVLAGTTMIRLKAQAGAVMITNDDHDKGNENIGIIGGIWNMDNRNQALTAYQKDRSFRAAYSPDLYTGVLMRFNRVKNLIIRGVTLKDPVTFGMQLGNLRQFTIEDITFDYNLERSNMDGVHVNGNSRLGRIANVKGTTNDDMVALNADDAGWAEMSRGPIEDVSTDGIFSENGYTAVRLLSAGSPIRRVQISNIFGTYRFNLVSFTNHRVHPGTASTFEDVSIRDVFCSKSISGTKYDPAKPGPASRALIWIDAPAVVSNLAISGFHRTETAWAAENMLIEPGARVERLRMNDVSLINHTAGPIHVLTNRGTIEFLQMSAVYAKADEKAAGAAVVSNQGAIGHPGLNEVFTANVTPGIVK